MSTEDLALDVVPMQYRGGQVTTAALPGYSGALAPRRLARGRDRDVLLLGLALYHHRDQSPAQEHLQLFDHAAEKYYTTAGPITSAARAAIQLVNDRLMAANRSPNPAGMVHGGLICAVLREDHLYLIQAGPGEALVLQADHVQRFPVTATRPLGSSNTPEVQYYHCQLHEGDLLLLGRRLPQYWQPGNLAKLNLGKLRTVLDKLVGLVEGDAAALVAQVVGPDAPLRLQSVLSTLSTPAAPEPTAATPAAPAASSSQLAAILERAREADDEDGEPLTIVDPTALAQKTLPSGWLVPGEREAPPPGWVTPPPKASAQPAPPVEAAPADDAPADDESPGDDAGDEPPAASDPPRQRPARTPAPPPSPPPAAAAVKAPPRPAVERTAPPTPKPEPVVTRSPVATPPPVPEPPPPPAPTAPPGPPPDRLAWLKNGFESFRRWFIRLPLLELPGRLERRQRTLFNVLGVGSAELAGRLLPEGDELRTNKELPNRIYAITAILLPVLIGVFAFFVWDQRGRQVAIQSALDAARDAAKDARLAPDEISARPHWEEVIYWADQSPEETNDLLNLRLEALGHIDALDNIIRLEMQPIPADALPVTSRITRLVTNGNEVYAFDANNQRVYHLIYTREGQYTFDVNFKCGADQSEAVSHIIDIAWLSSPNITGQEALIALDYSGTLLYCRPNGQIPQATHLNQPGTGWSSPLAVRLFADRMYVLDPGKNDIWVYESIGETFEDTPDSYFSQNVYDLSDAIDFVIAQGEVFILRQDGRMTSCTRNFAGAAPTCTEIVRYTDTRPGRNTGSGERLEDVAAPLSLAFTPPPEPSLFITDANNRGAYQLSLKLVLQHQYRPAELLDSPVTAAAFGTDKSLYYALGNTIYVGHRP